MKQLKPDKNRNKLKAKTRARVKLLRQCNEGMAGAYVSGHFFAADYRRYFYRFHAECAPMLRNAEILATSDKLVNIQSYLVSSLITDCTRLNVRPVLMLALIAGFLGENYMKQHMNLLNK